MTSPTSPSQCQEEQHILEQKKMFLSFEDICKEWSHYISSIGGIEKIIHLAERPVFVDSNGIQRSLDKMNSCIVGEAHGGNRYDRFKTPTYCGECELFSMGFYGSSNKYEVKDETSFEIVKSQFVNHFNEVHVH